MKKQFSLMLLLATLCLCFTSCSDDDGVPQSEIQENIVGTWVGVSAEIDGKWVSIEDNQVAVSATFYADGTYYGEGALGTGSGTYEVKGNTVYTYVGGSLYLKYVVKSMYDYSAEMTVVDGSTSINIRAKKLRQ